MFEVKHDLTHYTWIAQNKEELLVELDFWIAKYRERKLQDKIVIQQLEDGKVLDSITLELPTQDSVDNELIHFGADVMKPQPSRLKRFNVLKKFVQRFKFKKSVNKGKQNFYQHTDTTPPTTQTQIQEVVTKKHVITDDKKETHTSKFILKKPTSKK